MVIMSGDTRENHALAATGKRWRTPWVESIAALLVIAGTLVFSYPHIASWFSQQQQSRVTELALAEIDKPPHNDPVFRSTQLDEAHRYNAALSSGAIYQAYKHVAQGTATSADMPFIYDDLLSVSDTGVMGRLTYESLNIDLPIYHGTSEETLKVGIGHLEGTSLPVGGDGTRSVLTAHRGLPEATLFTELDRAEVGDTFTLTVVDQVLTYRVISTQVIEPNETEAILPMIDRDVVTLLTCTPLGINTHRILVNAERITPTPIGDVQRARAVPELPGFPWWAVGLGVVTVVVGGFVWRSGYRVSRDDQGIFGDKGEDNTR